MRCRKSLVRGGAHQMSFKIIGLLFACGICVESHLGMPIEIDPTSPGVMIAINDAEMPLADYARG